jgi:transmembrane sensor
MRKTRLDDLLYRYLNGQVTPEEKAKIEAWLDVKKTDEGADLVLDEHDEEKLFRKITSSIDSIEEIKRFRPEGQNSRRLFSNRWLQVAASLLFLVVASWTVWLIAAKVTVHETITHNAMRKVILQDSTIVWLEKESRLTFVNNDDRRLATLEGEALFEVAKEPSRPFAISCGDLTVKVVGTSFHLKSREYGIELKVLTGKVHVSSVRDTAGIDVAPNERAVYLPQGEIKKSPLDTSEVKTVIAGTEYNMEFKNTTMESVVARIEKKFDVHIVLENSVVNRCRITADFTDHSLASTLNMIEELLEIEYRIDNNTVTISGNGCN